MTKSIQMMKYILSFLCAKERDFIFILSFLLSSALYSQIVIVGESQISLKGEADLFVDGKKIENSKDFHLKSVEKAIIYVSSDALVTNLGSETVEIVEIESTKSPQPIKSKSLASSKTVSKTEVIAKPAIKKTEKPVYIFKSLSSENTLFNQSSAEFSLVIQVQNSSQKQFLAIADIGSFLQFINLLPNFHIFYENTIGYPNLNLTSFSVRPPPVYYNLS